MKKFMIGVLGGLMLLGACDKKEPDPVPAPKPPTTTPADQGLAGQLPFPFGGAVNISLMKSRPAYMNVVTKEYSSVTAENAMKFKALHPERYTYDWTDADYLVEYARITKKRVHGHTLIWHASNPAWISSFNGTTAQWEAMFKEHIQTVVTRYKGKIESWDVVNEAIDNDGNGLRESTWRTQLGDDYIARAFQYAHEADPNAKLFYNDYGHEWGDKKRNAILNLVKSLQARGIPIHGVGLQMHTRYTQGDATIAAAINASAQTGLLVHISELDISMNPDKNKSLVFTKALEEEQARKYKSIVKVYNAIPKAQQFGITTWNVGDADSWVPGFIGAPDWPLPFDKDYKAKLAYQGIVDGTK